ncbi:MAG: hypothetical protein ACO1OX_06575 [Novosphingobium sp.]
MSEELQADNAATLRDKVDAAKSRLAERTAGSKSVQTVKGLIEEHPVASVAAGILLGALVAKALPSLGRSNGKARGLAEDTASSLRKSASGLAAVAGKLAIDYATRAKEAGRDGLHKVEELSGTVGGKIVDGSDEARRKAGDLSEIIRSVAIEASEAALRKVNELTSRVKP